MTILFRKFIVRLIRAAIHKALKRNAPTSIPLSGWERLQGRNYYTVHLGNVDDEHVFLVDSNSEVSLGGYWWNEEERNGYPASVHYSNLPCMVQRWSQYFDHLAA